MTSKERTSFRFWVRPKVSVLLFLVALGMASCNGSCQNGSQPVITNVLPLQISDPFGGSAANVLTTTITLCNGPSNCQTIDHIQVDTGSSGLRIFRQALTIGLTTVTDGQAQVGLCESFAIGNSWGQLETASLTLGSEPAINVFVQVIDSSFATQTPPAPCDSGNWSSPSDIHANGILGIDAEVSDSGVYFDCQGSTCAPWSPPTAQLVLNPVSSLPQDNNGVIINLPNVPDNGQATASGDLVLGIGTQWDNDPKSYSANTVLTVSLDPSDPLSAATTADGMTFIQFAADSGSNAFYFTDPGIASCPSFFGPALPSPWYCPASPKNFGVQVAGTNGSQWRFQGWIRDESVLAGTGNLAFNDLGGNLGDPDLFIAGLPFFYGKQVYIGFSNKSSSLGAGPLYAYANR